jgi:multiple sugar transport system substrate-binding protein
VTRNDQARQLFRDAFAGRISRREVMKRGAALGLSAMTLAALSQEATRSALAQDRQMVFTVYQWQFDLHPTWTTVMEENDVQVDIAPVAGFSLDRFVAESQKQESTWDAYTGVTPFLEMIALAESGTIEPWDTYLPAGAADDLLPATKAEGTYKDQLYVFPLLLDVIVQGWNAEIITKAGLDPEVAPKNWDEFLANAQKVKDSGAAPYGCIFDFHDWRSLIPITHSISTDVYTAEGLFRYTSDAAVQAIELMKRMLEFSTTDLLQEGTTDGGVNNTPDEQIYSAQQAGYYIKYQNAHLRFAATWPDPSQNRLGALPVQEGGAGGTVFWDTGAVLFKYGQNKQKAAEFLVTLSKDDRIWEESIAGNAETGIPAVGQLPILQSKWAEWEAAPPDFITANPWAVQVKDGLAKASAIAPSILAASQFTVARPEWVKYLKGEEADAKTALQKAQDAVAAEYKKQTGKDATY